MEYATHLLIVLIAAKALGWGALKLRQPASVGEIAAGALLGLAIAAMPLESQILGTLPASPAIEWIAEAGIFFLMLYAGAEMQLEEIAAHTKESVMVALGGVVLPLVLGVALGWAVLPDTPLKTAQALVIGVGLSISAVPVAAKVFMELGLLHRPIGEIVISAALFDDVIALMLLAIVTSLIGTGEFPDVLTLAVLFTKVAAFFLVSAVVGIWVYPWIWRAVAVVPLPGTRLLTLIVLGLAFSLLAESLGMHFVLGPFVAGLFFDEARVGKEAYVAVKLIVNALAMGVLGPIFFASIGLRMQLGSALEIPGFLTALVAVAFFGKLLGAGLPARWSGLGWRDSAAVGVGMSGRGAVELVFISIADKAGVFAGAGSGNSIVDHLFSAMVMTAVITTLMVPEVLRWILVKR